MNLPYDDQLRARAYAIWEREGRPSGKDRDHWDLAVKEMAGQSAPVLDQGPWRTPQEDGPQEIRKPATEQGEKSRQISLGSG